VQPRHQSGHRIAKADFQPLVAVLDVVAGGEQKGRDARVDIEVQGRHDQRHAEGVLQDRFPGAENLLTIGVARQHQRLAGPRRVGRGQADAQARQGVAFAARLLKGMNHGNHERLSHAGHIA
jgi:hypothetical protein